MNNQDLTSRLSNIENLLSSQKDEILTTEQAADFLNFSKSYLYKLTYQNRLPVYRPGGKKMFFSKNELLEWIKSKRNSTEKELEQEAINRSIH